MMTKTKRRLRVTHAVGLFNSYAVNITSVGCEKKPSVHRVNPAMSKILRSKAARIFGILILIWLFACLLIGGVVLVYAQQDQAQEADVIIVLGSGLRRDNRPGPALARRSRHAADLYAQGLASTVICTGGYTAGRTRSEAEGCREMLIENGVPEDAILIEDQSRSTEENALYSHEIMRENGFENAILVSDGFHLLRAQWIFSQVGVPVYPSPGDSPSTMTLLISTAREVAALHWQAIKTILNLPFTYVPVV